ncbi:MAG: LysR family transcriptional regulator [Bacteroidota bacterium]
MNYTLHQLRIFVKVCEYQSITKASEALFLTQPAVSIQLKKLQQAFEIPLVEVIGRQLYVTDFGQKIRERAEEILRQVELIEVATDQFKGLLTGEIRIASASTGKYVIPYFLTGFQRQHPGVKISIDVTNKTKVVTSLQDNAVDFAMVSVVPDNLPLATLPLIDNELHLTASTAYPDLPEKMTPKRLAKYPLILREEGSATRAAMLAFLQQAGIPLNRTMELVSNEAVKQAVRAGLGLSIMPIIGIRGELSLGNLRTILMRGLPIITQWNLAYNRGKKLSPAGVALLDYLREHKTQVAAEHFPFARVTE